MEHLLIGLTVGLIMGLTGAGGALVSIPLFMTLLSTSLKDSTVLSLIAVVMGTAINLFRQEYKSDKKIVTLFVIFGAMANYATLPLKEILPDLAIAGLLIAIGLYSVWGIWKKSKGNQIKRNKESILKIALIGIGLGIITTLTGLGGGVLLVPILIKFFSNNFDEALPTSLLTIFFISLISLLLQIELGMSLISPLELGQLGIGTAGAYLLLKWSVQKINRHKVDLTRKIVFTLVTTYSVSSVLIKSF